MSLPLLLSACGTNNSTEGVGDTPSTSVSVPSQSTTVPAKELEVTNGSVVYSKKHVIVNAANQWLAPGGVLSGAIFGAAGADKVLAEIASAHGGGSNATMSGTPLLKTSEVFTTGAYDLSKQGTQFIIHALGPDFSIAPYSGNIEQGYTDLHKTYKSIYAEMDRLNKRDNVTSLGIVPISSGAFAGSADLTKLYQIMIDETLVAMQTYPALQPELYLFGQREYDAVKELLKSTVGAMQSSAALSVGSVAQASKLALLEAPVHVAHVGTLNFQGVATSLRSLRFMGGIVEGVNERLIQLTIGKMNRGSFLGCELETAYHDRELSYYTLKATGVVQISDNLKLVSGVGYACENMAVNLSNNVRNFLNLASKDYERTGVVCDVLAQHQNSFSLTVLVTTSLGIRAEYVGKSMMSPFMRVACNIERFAVSVAASQYECGVRFDINN
ncbi:macro domain-containing protein [Candidatus Bodocaedibacter vickermanii]|uniref:macro domain-containing protein n=1 Tax=Candidatus Bodocaedibacter vickermanii TaxID=2741701 RepID=UPI0033078C1E